jgi:hypothetical protein
MTLPSWNDTQTKQTILDFVAAASDKNSSDYVPPPDRIAAFDNDGTLWVEQPAPAQTGLLLGKIVEQVKADTARLMPCGRFPSCQLLLTSGGSFAQVWFAWMMQKRLGQTLWRPIDRVTLFIEQRIAAAAD